MYHNGYTLKRPLCYRINFDSVFIATDQRKVLNIALTIESKVDTTVKLSADETWTESLWFPYFSRILVDSCLSLSIYHLSVHLYFIFLVKFQCWWGILFSDFSYSIKCNTYVNCKINWSFSYDSNYFISVIFTYNAKQNTVNIANMHIFTNSNKCFNKLYLPLWVNSTSLLFMLQNFYNNPY